MCARSSLCQQLYQWKIPALRPPNYCAKRVEGKKHKANRIATFHVTVLLECTLCDVYLHINMRCDEWQRVVSTESSPCHCFCPWSDLDIMWDKIAQTRIIRSLWVNIFSQSWLLYSSVISCLFLFNILFNFSWLVFGLAQVQLTSVSQWFFFFSLSVPSSSSLLHL